MKKLSLSLFFGHHDSSVTIADEKMILLHLEAERFFREKHCRIKTLEKMDVLVKAALDHTGFEIGSVDRLYLSTLSNPLPPGKVKINGRYFDPFITTHHNCHIGTVLDHGFQRALIVVADGGSEDGSTKIYFHDKDDGITMLEDLGETAANGKFYGSLTMLVIDPDFLKAHGWYSGKTMGLSAYGTYSKDLEQKLADLTPRMLWGNVLDVSASRSFIGLNEDYSKPWKDKLRMDLAYTGQKYWESCFLKNLEKHKHLTENIIMVGGCAMNVLLNSAIVENGLFKNIHLCPAPGDGGQSIGSILFHEREISWNGPYLGRGFGEVGDFPNELPEDLLGGKFVAWYQGRSEIGPRALGHRSLLGLPNSVEQCNKMNRLKGREPYRPVAPIVPLESYQQYFDTHHPSPFMSFAPKVRSITRQLAPAIVHKDGTSRMQTLSNSDNPILHRTLEIIGEETGIPILMNTSFNFDGEAMVDTPDDAIKSFESSRMDVLYINGERITRKN